jgi:hypothetical protein
MHTTTSVKLSTAVPVYGKQSLLQQWQQKQEVDVFFLPTMNQHYSYALNAVKKSSQTKSRFFTHLHNYSYALYFIKKVITNKKSIFSCLQ